MILCKSVTGEENTAPASSVLSLLQRRGGGPAWELQACTSCPASSGKHRPAGLQHQGSTRQDRTPRCTECLLSWHQERGTAPDVTSGEQAVTSFLGLLSWIWPSRIIWVWKLVFFLPYRFPLSFSPLLLFRFGVCFLLFFMLLGKIQHLKFIFFSNWECFSD